MYTISSPLSLLPSPPTIADIAIDWIGNNIYWTELGDSRIVVFDLDSGRNATLLQAAPGEAFRAIAVDSTRRYNYLLPCY